MGMGGGAGSGMNVIGMVFDYVAQFEAWNREDRAWDETTRRQDREFGALTSQVQGLGAASGVQSNSASLTNYLSAMKDEFTKQREYDGQVFSEIREDSKMAFGWKYLNDFGSLLSMGMGGGGGGGMGGMMGGGGGGQASGPKSVAGGTSGFGGSYYDAVAGGFKFSD